jgi:hypothetical protein
MYTMEFGAQGWSHFIHELCSHRCEKSIILAACILIDKTSVNIVQDHK